MRSLILGSGGFEPFTSIYITGDTTYAVMSSNVDGDSANLFSMGGTLANGILKLTAAPGVGNSCTAEILKNGSATGITATVSDLAVSSDFSADLSVNQFDTLSIKISFVGSFHPIPMWGFEFYTTGPIQPMFSRITNSQSGGGLLLFNSFIVGPAGALQVSPISGVFSAVYGKRIDAYGTTAHMGLNGASWDISSIGSVDAVSINKSVDPGDLLALSVSTATNAAVGFTFTPNDGQSILLPGTSEAQSVTDGPIVGETRYNNPNVMPSEGTVSALYVRSAGIFGTGRSATFTLTKNAVPTSLSVTLGGFYQISKASFLTVPFSRGDTLGLKVDWNAPGDFDVAFSFAIKIGGGGATQTAAFQLKQLGKQTQQTATFQIKNPAQPQWVQQARFDLFFPSFDQTARQRLAANLDQGEGWTGPWSVIENGVVGPAPSPGFQPTDDPNLFAWFRSDRNLLLSGSNVATGVSVWKDQSANHRDLDSAAGTEPAYTAADTPSGKGAITFLAGGSKILAMPTSVVGLGQPWTHLLLVKATAWNANQYISDGGGVGQQAGILQSGVSPQVTAYSGNLGPNAGGLTLNVYHVLTVIFDGTNLVIQVDNGTDATGNVGTQIPARIRYGNYAGGGANGAAFRLAASILVSGHVSSTMRAAHKQWLADYGGITL